MEFLRGKKTIIGSLMLALIGATASLDLLIDGVYTWAAADQYAAAGAFIAGLTGAAMRLGIRRPR